MTADVLTKDTTVSSPEDDVRQYMREIRQYPRLTAQQEQELAQRCAAGDEDAMRQMVNSNLRLVVSVAREYAGRGVPLLDLIQEGSIGLLYAVKKFDYTLEFRFSTYATKWIRQGISRCLAEHGMIRVPNHTGERIRKVLVAKAQWIQEFGSEPTLQELADRCQIPLKKVEQLLQLNPEVCSLDSPTGEDEITFSALLQDIHAPQPYEQMVRRELNQMMTDLLSGLNDRQQQTLRLYFGMEDGVCYSLEQIGKILGVSKERARQIWHQALQKLQKQGAALGLEDFLT